MSRPRKRPTLPPPESLVLQPLDVVVFRAKRPFRPDGLSKKFRRPSEHTGTWTPRGILEALPDGAHKVWSPSRVYIRQVLRGGALVAVSEYP